MLDFLKRIKITYGITVCNEYAELKLLLDTLLPLKDRRDEVLVLQDITNENSEVTELIKSYGKKVKRIEAKLNGDFSTFKNNLVHYSTGDYLFQIDADEYPTRQLIKGLKKYLKKEKDMEIFYVPRINIVEGITDEYVKEMGWNLNEKGYVNFPDYQSRIIKNNKKIFWKNKVHEILYGNTTVHNLPQDYDLCLIHKKTFERQKKQNDFYETLD